MYPIPKVHWNHEFLTYIIIIKGCYWKIKSVNKDLPLISNRIQSMHEIIIVFQKRNNDQIWKPDWRAADDSKRMLASANDSKRMLTRATDSKRMLMIVNDTARQHVCFTMERRTRWHI